MKFSSLAVRVARMLHKCEASRDFGSFTRVSCLIAMSGGRRCDTLQRDTKYWVSPDTTQLHTHAASARTVLQICNVPIFTFFPSVQRLNSYRSVFMYFKEILQMFKVYTIARVYWQRYIIKISLDLDGWSFYIFFYWLIYELLSELYYYTYLLLHWESI